MIYIAGLLTAILLIAQIGGYIAVSWWLVFAPILVAMGLGLIILLSIAFLGAWLEK